MWMLINRVNIILWSSTSSCALLSLHEVTSNNLLVTEKLQNDASVTGGAYDFGRATKSLTQKLISYPKKVTLVRHGLSSWNDEGRVQVCHLLFIITQIFYYVSAWQRQLQFCDMGCVMCEFNVKLFSQCSVHLFTIYEHGIHIYFFSMFCRIIQVFICWLDLLYLLTWSVISAGKLKLVCANRSWSEASGKVSWSLKKYILWSVLLKSNMSC